jgi:CRISPR/Cas system-associated exonuclease Cas4 (RecB family)
MSTIKSKPTTIQISMLGTHAYCEYRVYLELVLGYKAYPTKAMLQGTHAHHAHPNPNIVTFITQDSLITIEDALLKAKSEARETTKNNVRVYGSTLRGIIDEIHIVPDEITIIDDKPCDKPHQSYINQVFGYCLAFKEQYNPKQPLYGAIRNYKADKEIWRELYSAEQEQQVNDSVNRIQGIIRGDIKPIPADVLDKCWSCGFYERCDARKR